MIMRAAKIRRRSRSDPRMVVPPLNSPRGTTLEAALFDVTGAKSSGRALYGTDGGWFTGSNIVTLICGPGESRSGASAERVCSAGFV